MTEFNWTATHQPTWGEFKPWTKLDTIVLKVSSDKMMTLVEDTVKVLEHWETVKRREDQQRASRVNEPVQAAATAPEAPPPIEISTRGPWTFWVPEVQRQTGDRWDPTGSYKKRLCAYFQACACDRGEFCEWFHIGHDDKIRHPASPKNAIPEWVVSQ